MHAAHRPANVLVLDELTNDLDLETLELLEAELVNRRHAVAVSHDRVFLDNVVTTLVFEGGGRVQDTSGLRRLIRQRVVLPVAAAKFEPVAVAAPPAPRQVEAAAAAQTKKLSYKERRTLEELPEQIRALEAEQRAVEVTIADPAFYRQAPAGITATLERAAAIAHELVALYGRWDELDSRSK